MIQVHIAVRLLLPSLLIMGSIVRVEAELAPKKPSVCVVGGGMTGLVIANRLQNRGESVVVFEKSAEHIGGKLDTNHVWDVVWEKGPVIFSSGEEHINRYVNNTGLTRVLWNGSNVGFFNPLNASVTILNEDELQKWREKVTPLVGRYTLIRDSYPPWIFEARGFEHVHILVETHPDLFLHTEEWLETHDLRDLRFVFEIIFTCEGYGHLRDLPALYMLKLLQPSVVKSLGKLILGGGENGDIFTIQEGFRELPYRLANSTLPLFMDHDLVTVIRSGYNRTGRLDLVFRTARGTQWHTVPWCKQVVLAFPPLLPKMTKLIDDISLEEKMLFSKVRVNKYFSSGHILYKPKGEKFVYLAADNSSWRNGDGRPIALVQSGKGRKDAYTVYSWLYGRYDEGPNPGDVGYIDDVLSNFLYEFNESPPLLSFVEGYEYFPHVLGSDMKAGFFKELAELQGRRGLYFATTVTSFESVNTAIENAEAVADRITYGGDTFVPFAYPPAGYWEARNQTMQPRLPPAYKYNNKMAL